MSNFTYLYFLKSENGIGINRFALFLSILCLLISIEAIFTLTNIFLIQISIINSVLLIAFSFLPALVAYIISIIREVVKILAKVNSAQLFNNQEKRIEQLATQLNRIETRFLAEKLYSDRVPNFESSEKKGNEIQQQISTTRSSAGDLAKYLQELNLEKLDSSPPWPILLRALHFPKDVHDKLGFEALATARKHKDTADLLIASEDLMSLLAHEGIYLDDHDLYVVTNEEWIRFISNENDEKQRTLNCVGFDLFAKHLQLRVQNDIIFRDANLTLLRRFDKMLRNRIKSASKEEVCNLSHTRTGKAFILAGKISRTF